MSIKTAFMSALALIAFAGNSVLCRLALSDGAIHPASFTSVRLASGALTLFLLVWLSSLGNVQERQTLKVGTRVQAWRAPVALFAYAALFSFAYISLDTGVGALILFGSVQITMVLFSLFQGSRLRPAEWLGLLIACSGLVYLVFPELSEPSLVGFVMMSLAGVAWGAYTIFGKGSTNPLRDTSSNFIKSIPFALLMILPFYNNLSATPEAWLLAICSGAITSGVGYAIWYSALRNLTTSQAGVMQLLVPIIAAIGGVVLANETLSIRLVVSSTLTLGGILLVMLVKEKAH